MGGRRLDPEEAALWARVRQTVRPLAPGAPAPATPLAPRIRAFDAPSVVVPPPREARGTTLDGGWERRIVRGGLLPDRTIDLHGHTLASAHVLLERSLDQAVRDGDRVLLLITGKPPRAGSERPHARGAIRASVDDWLRGSRHAARIAAVRGAHPRHGGAGALYIILRRPRVRSEDAGYEA